MSLLAAGRTLRGTRWDYRIEHALKGDTAARTFKAKVFPRVEHAFIAPKWAVIKTAFENDKRTMDNIDRERRSYIIPGVAASPTCFRQMYDVLDEKTVALEWMDTSLAQVPYDPKDPNLPSIIKAILKSALTTSDILGTQGWVNTDFKPENILLNEVGTKEVSAKVGDLGLVIPSGEKFNEQDIVSRAPEVFYRQPCVSSTQVWAIAAMMLNWIEPGLFGPKDTPSEPFGEAWSMMKLQRLFPDWELPPGDGINRPLRWNANVDAMSLADRLATLQNIEHLELQMEHIDMSRRVMDLLNIMFILDPAKRPTPREVLASYEFNDVKTW